jgi:hypothetical protein
MLSNDTDLLKLVNASGFLFQLKVEQLISETSDSHGKSILAREHKWIDPRTGNEGFIDLITTAGTNGKIVIECKRVRDAEWIFLVPHDAQNTMNTRVLWSRRFSETHQGAAWDDFGFNPESLESEFCIVRGQGEKQTPMLERLSAILIGSVEALADEELSYERSIGRTGLRFYFPVIITAATLHVCRVQSSDIELKSGDLQSAIFEEVPFIRFTKSMPSNLTSSRPPSQVTDAARENRRTVFIVNAENLVAFLSGRWEFNPPAWGGPWPWDLPVWQG